MQLMAATRPNAGTALAFAGQTPLDMQWPAARFRLPGESPRTRHVTLAMDVSKEVPPFLGMPIVMGRGLVDSDGDDAILINESMARTYWPDENPVGKTVIERIERRVVGVVRDASLSRLDRVEPTMFRPIEATQVPVMLVRASLERSRATIRTMSAVAERIDPRVRVSVDSIAGNLDRQLEGLRTSAVLAGILGVIATVLACVGVFGVFAYVVQQRTREIGVRTALGAPASRVVTLLLRDSMRSLVAGLVVGAAAAIAVARILASELYGASPFDPIVLAGAALLLTAAGLMATLAPARRAAQIDPLIALRHE
jgi:hypothetical protein